MIMRVRRMELVQTKANLPSRGGGSMMMMMKTMGKTRKEETDGRTERGIVRGSARTRARSGQEKIDRVLFDRRKNPGRTLRGLSSFIKSIA